MKTANEWTNIHPLNECNGDITTIIKQIQLDAWKQGMEDASKICLAGSMVFKQFNSSIGIAVCDDCSKNILIEREERKEI